MPVRRIVSAYCKRWTDRRFERLVATLRVTRGSLPATRRTARRLIAERRFAEAEAVLRLGLAAHPDRPGLLEMLATILGSSHRQHEALVAYRRLMVLQPDRWSHWVGVSINARSTGNTGDALQIMQRALERFPGQPDVLHEAARAAYTIGDYELAAARWTPLLEQPGARADWRQGYNSLLIALGDFDRAASDLKAALDLYPDDFGLAMNGVCLALAREDWDEALAAVSDILARYPDDLGARELQGQALMGRGYIKADRASRDDARPAAIAVVEDDETRSMLLGFENLGDDCEFGLVQRRYQAEPLGLLRFNSLSIERLTEALTARFAGVGSESQTVLSVRAFDEYFIEDRRFGLGMHTFLSCRQVSYESLFPKSCRRMAYLRDWLIADLECGEKVFVYKTKPTARAALFHLHDCLRAYGPVRLVCVVAIADGLHDRGPPPIAGTIEMLRDGLFLGYLTRGGRSAGIWDIEFDEWISICGKVLAAR